MDGEQIFLAIMALIFMGCILVAIKVYLMVRKLMRE